MEFFNEKIRNYIASNLDLDNQFNFEKFKVGRSNITFKIFDEIQLCSKKTSIWR